MSGVDHAGALKWLDAQCDDENANERFREVRHYIDTLRAQLEAAEAELSSLKLLAKQAQWLHAACWDMADGTGCFISKKSMERFDEVFNQIGVAVGDIVIDEEDEADMFRRPGAVLARAEAAEAECARLDALEARWRRIADEKGTTTFTGNDHALFANELRAARTKEDAA